MSIFKDLYEYREMIFSLVRKDLRGRYKGSVLGFFWTFLNPFLQLMVFTLVFSIIMPQDIDQYYLFLFVALVPWMFFASSVQDGSTSILRETNMVKKIYFPREVLPIATVTSGFVNMLLVFLVIFVTLIISGRGLSIQTIFYLPIVMIVQYVLCLGIALIVSSITVYFRDLQYILGILVMALQYMTPVMYDMSRVQDAAEKMGWPQMVTLYNLNPMTPIVTIYRDILYYQNVPKINTLIEALVVGIVFIVVGEILFKKLQKGFAEEF